MSDTVIRVENLGKLYRIGLREKAPRTLRKTVAGLAGAPFKYLRSVLREPAPEEVIWSLKDVSFEVKQGEVVGIIGRNGAGKSTLLKILSQITEPSCGYAEIRGRVGSLLEVGTGFHPDLTGRENTYLNGTIMGMKKREIDRRFDEIVAFAEVEKFIDTPVKYYSSGMYTRLAFAVAAHLEPEILIVDEVLAVGDAQFQKKCLGKMEDVAEKEGRTVLFVSHNIATVRKLCGYTILLNQGKVDNQGRTETVLKKYIEGGADTRSVYTIQFPKDENIPGYAHKVIIEDGQGNPVTAIPVGQPWQIRVHFTITRKIEHFIIGLGFRTIEDVALRTCWSEPCFLRPGEYQAVFREETIILGSGRYSVIVGFSSHNQTFHYVENAAFLEIAEFSDGIDLVKILNVGFMLNPLKVKIFESK